MSEKSISKLQNKVTVLENKIISLQDIVAVRKEKYFLLKKKFEHLEKNFENATKKAVIKATESLSLENEKLKLENEKLRKMLNLDGNNSGIPTSKTPIGKKKRIPNLREKSNKKIGGQLGHLKNKLTKFNDEEITDNYYHEINKCTCGGKLDIVGNRTKDEFDIEVRVKKIRHYFMEYKCHKCNKLINVPIPKELKEENQYGNNAKSIAISLINEGCVSYNRTRNLIRGFSNDELDISEGFLVKLQKQCSDKLDTFMNDLKVKIINQKKINWDDTVITINGKNACLRFYSTERLAYYVAHEKKNKETLDNDGILNNLSKETVVIHDHNTVNYNKNYEFTNAESCVHLLRNLKSLNENLNRDWLNEMINFLIETNKKRNEYMNKDIDHFEDEFIDFCMEEYDRIILFAKQTNTKDFNKYYGNDEKTLINRLVKYKENYLMWIMRFDIDFSNNLSERSLRSSKTKMKISGQFKNLENARYYSNIKSYIETCKKNNINEHEAIIRLFEDNPISIKEIFEPQEKESLN